MNRREFLKKSFWAVGIFGLIGPSQVLGSNRKGPAKPITSLKGYPLDRTIFCQFDNPALKREIEKLANGLGCRVYYGKPDTFDIIGVPYFVAIIDRKLVGREAWEAYLEYCRQTGDQTPCLIIDGQVGLEFPSHGNFILLDRFDKTNDRLKKLIVSVKPRNSEANGKYAQETIRHKRPILSKQKPFPPRPPMPKIAVSPQNPA